MQFKTLADNTKSKFQLSTGSIKLDHCLNGALRSGRIYEIFGVHSSGKSTLAYQMIACAEKQNLRTLYIDAEFKCDEASIRANGVSGDNLVILSENNMELIFQYLKSGEFATQFDVVVFDSLTAVRSMHDTSCADTSYNTSNGSAIVSAFMADFASVCAKNDILCVVIDQIRFSLSSQPVDVQKMGFENRPTSLTAAQLVSSCGNAVSHHATARIQLVETQPIYEKGCVDADPSYQKTNFVVVKNHQGRPMMSGTFYIEYEKGLCVELEVADLAIKQGVFIVNASNQIEYQGSVIASSKAELISYLRDSEELKRTVMDAARGVVSVNELQEELDLAV